jgi:transcription antitermination factor NusG
MTLGLSVILFTGPQTPVTLVRALRNSHDFTEECMSVDCHDRHWYTIRTESRFEKIVRDQLADRGIETLLPLRARTSQWKGRTKVIEVALFAGYCFACCSPTQQLLVLQTPGVLEILHSQDVPESVVAEEMAGMQRLVQSSINYEIHPDPERGATVEIIRGPLTGIRGKSVRHGDQSWVVIPIRLIGRAVAVEI